MATPDVINATILKLFDQGPESLKTPYRHFSFPFLKGFMSETFLDPLYDHSLVGNFIIFK